MAGKPKIEVYEYTKQGSFVKKYISLSEVTESHYSDKKGKYPLFRNKNDRCHILPNGNMLVKSRIGREAIRREYTIAKNPLINYNSSVMHEKQVRCYDALGKKIATFENPYIASVLLNLRHSTVYSMLRRTTSGMPNNELKITLRYEQ